MNFDHLIFKNHFMVIINFRAIISIIYLFESNSKDIMG